MENVLRCQTDKIHELKKSFDLLTNIVVIQLNKINRLLIELEQET